MIDFDFLLCFPCPCLPIHKWEEAYIWYLLILSRVGWAEGVYCQKNKQVGGRWAVLVVEKESIVKQTSKWVGGWDEQGGQAASCLGSVHGQQTGALTAWCILQSIPTLPDAYFKLQRMLTAWCILKSIPTLPDAFLKLQRMHIAWCKVYHTQHMHPTLLYHTTHFILDVATLPPPRWIQVQCPHPIEIRLNSGSVPPPR